jgi:hypothetical protein
MNVMEATYLGYTFRTGVDTLVPHIQIPDSSKLSHVSKYAPARFGLGRISCAPKGPHSSLLIYPKYNLY